MDDPRIDRSTLKWWAKRVPKGVEVQATFSAAKTSGERGNFSVLFVIDVKTKTASLQSFDLGNRMKGSLVMQNIRRQERRRRMVNEARDVFWNRRLGPV